MNCAIILAGGIGSRMHMGLMPKQYMMYAGRPIISYSLKTFNEHPMIDKIIIVADEKWQKKIEEWICTEQIYKFFAFSSPGETRQFSIYNGLKTAGKILSLNDVVIIHDAARPLVSKELITRCLTNLRGCGGVVPVFPAKDTWYLLDKNGMVNYALPRNLLVAGQAPEAFDFVSYFKAHESMSRTEMAEIKGSAEMALRAGMSVRSVVGEEKNIKITTQDDLRLLQMYCEEIE